MSPTVGVQVDAQNCEHAQKHGNLARGKSRPTKRPPIAPFRDGLERVIAA